LYVVHRNSAPVKVRHLIDDFSAAVNIGNPRDMATFMCAEEAQSFLDTVENPEGPELVPYKLSYKVSDVDVHVHGDAASATLTCKPTGTQTMYFRGEGGKWTVCAPARDQM
jgi:ketosteroid isomerase-like protein